MADIDEKLERLAERHEALTQTMELLARQSLENDSRYHQRFEQIASTLESLLQLIHNHERRMSIWEGDSAA